jgi:hypothetical protein
MLLNIAQYLDIYLLLLQVSDGGLLCRRITQQFNQQETKTGMSDLLNAGA